jgi:hypothetical protein
VTWARRAHHALTSPGFAAPASVALLGFLASATSLGNGFVYDDGPIVSTNPRVHTLARIWEVFLQPYWPPGWGDLNYRPLTILSFALQWALGGGSPAIFHATNVVLYVAACVAVFHLAKLTLPQSAGWIAAALFAVHPVHVEAVGNVVGQAEIVVGLCSTLAVAAYVRLRGRPPQTVGSDRGPGRRIIGLLGVLYAVAVFSKETGFFLPALLLAAEVTVVAVRLDPGRRPFRARARELWALYAVCGAVGLGYLAMRLAVLREVGDDPNTVIALLGHKARLLTMLGVVPEWARLLLWPARLAADYSPPQLTVFVGFNSTLISAAAILAGCLLVSIAGWSGRRAVTFALLWIAVALFPVSNVLLRSGVILAERTLFLPSVGAVLAVGAAVAWVTARWMSGGRSWSPVAAAAVAPILVLGLVKSTSRQRVWRSNDTFYEHIVEDVPLGYRAHYMHGMWLLEKGRRSEGERHVRTAIALFPYDPAVYTDLADQYRRSGLCAPARQFYRRALDVGSLRPKTRLGLVACLLNDAQFAEARDQARHGLAAGGPETEQFRRMLAIADSVLAHQSVRTTQSGASRTARNQKGSPN